jgi:hypothetical protein
MKDKVSDFLLKRLFIQVGDPMDTASLWTEMFYQARNRGQTRMAAMGISARTQGANEWGLEY